MRWRMRRLNGKSRLFPGNRRLRGTDEILHRDAGDRDRVLERQKDTELCSLIDGKLCDVLSFEVYMTLSDLIDRISHDGVKQRRLACPIDTHNDMDFSLIHGEVNAV